MAEFKGTLPLGNKMRTIPLYNNGHWKFPEKMNPDTYMGFIYLIRDNVLERFYLGKKNYLTNSGFQSRDTGWQNYRTSSQTMADIFKFRPIGEFDFICLEQYKTKGTLSYAETWTLCFVEAPTNIRWYNTRIEKVSWTVKEPISERHKLRLARAVNMEKMDG